MAAASRSKVLSLFKTLHRTRERVFNGDERALKCSKSFEDRDNQGRRIHVTVSTHDAVYPWESGDMPDLDKTSTSQFKTPLNSSSEPFRYDLRSSRTRSIASSKLDVQEYVITKGYSSAAGYLIFLGTIQLIFWFISSRLEASNRATLLFVDILLSLVIGLSAAGRVYCEKFLVMHGVGFQVSEETYFGKIKSAQFVPLGNFKCLVINETIRMQRVIPYLAVILKSPDPKGFQIVPVFEKTLPRLRVLELIYQDCVSPSSPSGDMGKVKINEEFRKHVNVKDPEEISNLVQMAQEANQMLLTQVVQAKEVRPNVYRIRKEDLQEKCIGARVGCGRPDCHCVP